MRFSIYLLLFVFMCVQCKHHFTKQLTESMGQEIIEIGAPVKELPPGLDEEPSADIKDDKSSTDAPTPATKRETRKTTTVSSTAETQKIERRSENLSSEDEEVRVEKELSEIYKDTDYNEETSKTPPTAGKFEVGSVPVLRQKGRANFKFQPNIQDRADVERFRTSVDDISCEKRVTQRLNEHVSVVELEPEHKFKDSQHLNVRTP